MTQVQINTTSSKGSQHTSCAVLHMKLHHLTFAYVECLWAHCHYLCSDLPMVKRFFQSRVLALHFITNQFDSNSGKKNAKNISLSSQFQLWLLHTNSAGKQSKRQHTSLMQHFFAAKAPVDRVPEEAVSSVRKLVTASWGMQVSQSEVGRNLWKSSASNLTKAGSLE